MNLDIVIGGSGEFVATRGASRIVTGVVGRLDVGGARLQSVCVIAALEVAPHGAGQQREQAAAAGED